MALLDDVIQMDLFLDKGYRRKLAVDQELRKRFVRALETRLTNM